MSAIILLAAAIGSAALAWVLAWRLSRPVLALNRAALRIADGDLTQVIELETGDELGTLAFSFQRMTERLREIVAALKTSSTESPPPPSGCPITPSAQTATLARQAAGVSRRARPRASSSRPPPSPRAAPRRCSTWRAGPPR